MPPISGLGATKSHAYTIGIYTGQSMLQQLRRCTTTLTALALIACNVRCANKLPSVQLQCASETGTVRDTCRWDPTRQKYSMNTTPGTQTCPERAGLYVTQQDKTNDIALSPARIIKRNNQQPPQHNTVPCALRCCTVTAAA